jgi:hypothetical protein
MILTKALEVQLMRLIIEPFNALANAGARLPNRLIIIDGIDECINSDRESRIEKKYAEDKELSQIRVLNLIHTLTSHKLPLSFLILSRPEAWIKKHMDSVQFRAVVEVVVLCQVGDHMMDVERFVRAELTRLGIEDKDLAQRLVCRAGGHMLYASTIIRHIGDPNGNPRKRLQNLLNNYSLSHRDLAHSTPLSSFYELYLQIL